MADETYQEAALKTWAASLRQFFLALMQEGFTEEQAMELVHDMNIATWEKGANRDG